MWAKIITIKRTKDLNYFSLCAFNLFNTRVSQFDLNYWNKLTFPQHSNLLRCTCILKQHNMLNISNIIRFFFSCQMLVCSLHIKFTLFFLFTSHSLSCLSKEMDEFTCCKSDSSYSVKIALKLSHQLWSLWTWLKHKIHLLTYICVYEKLQFCCE